MAKRKSISKRVRFEVFKRDGFACQYCGAHPPDVVLHVDHIVAVSTGGTNDDDNLVTSCEPCNLGKGVRSLASVPQSLRAMADETAEREAQLAGWYAVMQAKRDRVEEDQWRVAEAIEPGCREFGMRRDWLGGIKRFNERLGMPVALDAAEKAYNRFPACGRKTFLYFCGICWALVRQKEAKEAA